MSAAPDVAMRGFTRPAILFETSLILVAALLDRVFETDLGARLQADLRLVLLGGATTLVPLAVLGWVVRSTWAPFVRLRSTVRTAIRPLCESATPLELLALAVAAGVGEELLFRGVIQSAIGAWTTPWIGVVAAAALFGAVHWVTRAYAAVAFGIGLVFGGVVVWTGSVVPAIVAHAAYDLIALAVLRRDGDPIEAPRDPPG